MAPFPLPARLDLKTHRVRTNRADAYQLQEGDPLPEGYVVGDYLVMLPQNDGPVPMKAAEFLAQYEPEITIGAADLVSLADRLKTIEDAARDAGILPA